MKALLFVSALALSSAAFAEEAPALQAGVPAKAPAAAPLSAKSAASHTGKHHAHHRHARHDQAT